MLYGHRSGNAYFRSYVENTVSCITYTRKNLGLIIVDDNRLIRLITFGFNVTLEYVTINVENVHYFPEYKQ